MHLFRVPKTAVCSRVQSFPAQISPSHVCLGPGRVRPEIYTWLGEMWAKDDSTRSAEEQTVSSGPRPAPGTYGWPRVMDRASQPVLDVRKRVARKVLFFSACA